jgi:hypothetical protein
MAGEEPVEQRGARPPDVQVPRRTRRKANANGLIVRQMPIILLHARSTPPPRNARRLRAFAVRLAILRHTQDAWAGLMRYRATIPGP